MTEHPSDSMNVLNLTQFNQDSLLVSDTESFGAKANATILNHNFKNKLLYTNGYKRLKIDDFVPQRKMATPALNPY